MAPHTYFYIPIKYAFFWLGSQEFAKRLAEFTVICDYFC